MATGETAPDRELRRADRRLRELEDEIESVGEDRMEAAADAYDRATGLLDRYEGRATGTGSEEFRAFVRFQQELGAFVESLPEDLPDREAFERMEDHLDKRRVSESDFQDAREALEEPGEKAELLADREQAWEQYRQARNALEDRIAELDDGIAERERVVELGETADLDAPIDRLRDPIETYDDAVRESFREFKRERPTREVFELVAVTWDYPLVDFSLPPEDLRAYVREHEAGTEPIPTLLEYSGYSRSKLSHYVDEPGELKRDVTTQQTYLRRLDAEPLTVGWPPPAADRLRFLMEERIAVCSRFAPERVIERAREVRDVPREVDYERLRETAVATDRLDDRTRRRLASGDVERELADQRDRRAELADLLSEYPPR
jgi:hypothetical protein